MACKFYSIVIGKQFSENYDPSASTLGANVFHALAARHHDPAWHKAPTSNLPRSGGQSLWKSLKSTKEYQIFNNVTD